VEQEINSIGRLPAGRVETINETGWDQVRIASGCFPTGLENRDVE